MTMEFEPGLYVFMSYHEYQNEPSKPYMAQHFETFAELELEMKDHFAEEREEGEELPKHEVRDNRDENDEFSNSYGDYEIGDNPYLYVSKVRFLDDPKATG